MYKTRFRPVIESPEQFAICKWPHRVGIVDNDTQGGGRVGTLSRRLDTGFLPVCQPINNSSSKGVARYGFSCHFPLWLMLGPGPSPFPAPRFPTMRFPESLFDDCLFHHALINGVKVHVELVRQQEPATLCHSFFDIFVLEGSRKMVSPQVRGLNRDAILRW